MNQPPGPTPLFRCQRCGEHYAAERQVQGMGHWHLPETLRSVLTDRGWLVLCRDTAACLARQAETRGIQ